MPKPAIVAPGQPLLSSVQVRQYFYERGERPCGCCSTYIVLAVIGNAIIYFIGLVIERMWPVASLPLFLLMFFVVLWSRWLAAVKITAPKAAAQS